MAPRIAANPIPYWLRGKVSAEGAKTFENLDPAFRDLAEIGFKAVKADVPEGMSTAAYLAWLDSYGLVPAVSLYNSTFDRTLPIAEDVERAKRFAAQQRQLGLDATMLCPIFVPERLGKPAVGANFDAGRLQNVIADIATVADALIAEGIRPLLHGHVGGWVETEYELRTVLDTLGPERLGFGPDTGHLTWCGMDPAVIISDYADRVGAIHLKDVFPDHIGKTEETVELSYGETAQTRRLWAEPGKGVVDLLGVVEAMPVDHAGDYMIEVDVPSIPSAYQSLKESYEWAVQNLRGVEI